MGLSCVCLVCCYWVLRDGMRDLKANLESRVRRNRLKAVGSWQAKPVINPVTNEFTHVVCRLDFRVERSLAHEREILTVGKIDMSFPRPAVCGRIAPYCSDKRLIAMRIRDFVHLTVL